MLTLASSATCHISTSRLWSEHVVRPSSVCPFVCNALMAVITHCSKIVWKSAWKWQDKAVSWLPALWKPILVMGPCCCQNTLPLSLEWPGNMCVCLFDCDCAIKMIRLNMLNRLWLVICVAFKTKMCSKSVWMLATHNVMADTAENARGLAKPSLFTGIHTETP